MSSVSSQEQKRDRRDRESALLDELSEVSSRSVLWSQAVADRAGIHPTDLESLDILRRQGPMSAGRLAALTGLSTGGAITSLIDRLERLGYVRREPDPADRRRVLVRAIPERAEQDLGPLYAALGQAMAELVRRYDDAEIDVILDFLSCTNAIVLDQITALRGARER